MDEAFESVDIALRPAIFRLSDLDDTSGIEFRDTLGIETKGKFPERAVAAIDVDTTEVKVYERGKLVDVLRHTGLLPFGKPLHIQLGVSADTDTRRDHEGRGQRRTIVQDGTDPSFLRYHSPQRAEELKMQARE